MTTQQQPPIQYVPAAPPGVPPVPGAAPAAPPAKATATTRRPKTPAWYTRPQVLAVIALVVALIGFILVGTLGWVWALAVVVGLVIVVFLAALAWRRKGKGGLLDRILGARGNRANRKGPGSRTGGGNTRAPGSGGRMAALRSRLPKALGGTRPGRNSRAGTPGNSGPSGGGKTGKWTPPWKRNKGGKTGGNGSGTGPGGSSSTGPGGKPKRNRPKGEAPGGKYNPLNWRSWKPGDIGHKRPDDQKPGGKNGPALPDRKNTKPSPGQTGQQNPGDAKHTRPAEPQQQDRGGSPKETRPAPTADRSNSTTGGNDMTMPYSDDQSLQRAGANLSAFAAAAEEIRKEQARVDAMKATYVETLGKATTQMENDMPSSTRLRAEMEDTLAKAKRASDEAGWGAVAGQAGTLPGTYRREHETDEDRLAGGRGGRHKEKRADVTVAEQDN